MGKECVLWFSETQTTRCLMENLLHNLGEEEEEQMLSECGWVLEACVEVLESCVKMKSLVGSKMNVVFLFQISKVGMSVDGGRAIMWECEDGEEMREETTQTVCGFVSERTKKSVTVPKSDNPHAIIAFWSWNTNLLRTRQHKKSVNVIKNVSVMQSTSTLTKTSLFTIIPSKTPTKKKKGWEKENNMTVFFFSCHLIIISGTVHHVVFVSVCDDV